MEIAIINKPKTISSLEVAEMIEKQHSHLMRDIRNYIEVMDDNPKLDSRSFFIESSYINTQKKKQPMYLLTKQGCEMVANKMTGSKGILFTALYVQKFNKLENQKKLPSNYKEALLALYEAEEEKERLQLEHKEMKPKAEFYDAVAGSKDAVEIGTVAKLIGKRGLGRNNLFEFLRNKKVLRENNQPYQKYVDCGYFRIVEQKWTTKKGETKINIKTLVYQKGIDYIRKLVN